MKLWLFLILLFVKLGIVAVVAVNVGEAHTYMGIPEDVLKCCLGIKGETTIPQWDGNHIIEPQ